MSRVKEIITDIETLSDWCVEIDPQKEGKLTQEIVLSLKSTMREHGYEYLTAPQIGYKKRMFCIRFGSNDYRTFINPVIENNSGITMVRETCISIPETRFVIPRFGKVRVYYMTPLSKVEGSTLVGRAAQVFQHCMDHLNGLLVSDIGLEIDDLFDQATDEEREEILKMYAESLDLRQKELAKEIEETPEIKQIDDAIDFINSVKDGSTVLDVNSNTKDN